MGVSTDAVAVPFQPQPPQPGALPSGIAQNQNIRGMANKAKQQVSDKQRQFISMMQHNATPAKTVAQTMPQVAQPTPVQKYASAAKALNENHDTVERFVDWVLFG